MEAAERLVLAAEDGDSVSQAEFATFCSSGVCPYHIYVHAYIISMFMCLAGM
jgi:hypothetical protein